MHMYLSLALTVSAGIGFGYGLYRFFRGKSVSYAACSVICQQAPDTSNISKMPVSRFISPENAVVNSRALLISDDDHERELKDGYTRDLPDSFNFGYRKSDFLPLGVYVAGCTGGREPLAMSDVVVCRASHFGTELNGEITFDLSGEKNARGGRGGRRFPLNI